MAGLTVKLEPASERVAPGDAVAAATFVNAGKAARAGRALAIRYGGFLDALRGVLRLSRAAAAPQRRQAREG